MQFKKLFHSKTDHMGIHLLRQIIGSLSSFSIEMGVFILLTTYLGVHYLISSALGFLIGNTLLYQLSIKWIYSKRRFSDDRLEFSLFLGISGFSLLVNSGFLFLLIEKCSINYVISKIIVGAVIFILNFIVKKFILFNHSHQREKS